MDAGTGTLAELQRHSALADLSAIWISHRHADHAADLLVTYYALRFGTLRPASPIPLIGPEGLVDRLAGFLGPQSMEKLSEVFAFTEMHGWGDAQFGDISLSWGPVSHGIPAFAVKASAGGSQFTYSGDTAPCISLIELAEGSQTLLCESGQGEIIGDEAPVHHTPEDAGRSATQAGVNRLILTHITESISPKVAARRAATAFTGTIEIAAPGAVFTV